MIRFIRNWTLPIAMVLGVISYFVYVNIPFLEGTYSFANKAVSIIQPFLIFLMLFLTFCKVNISDMHLCRWHLILLAFQALSFMAISSLLIFFPRNEARIVLEGAMICLICPTATAAAVITEKLGGKPANLTTYIILINMTTAMLIPAFVPFVHPHPDLSPLNAFLLILGKVFPLLLLPLVSAILARYLFPRLIQILRRYPDLSFYLWAVALVLAIAVTTKTIMHSHVSLLSQVCLAIVSLICCLLQFFIGRRVGMKYNDPISAAQSLGQKNTVLAIWMGYTFFTPITAVAGGFYSIWHNIINSCQLYGQRKKTK